MSEGVRSVAVDIRAAPDVFFNGLGWMLSKIRTATAAYVWIGFLLGQIVVSIFVVHIMKHCKSTCCILHHATATLPVHLNTVQALSASQVNYVHPQRRHRQTAITQPRPHDTPPRVSSSPTPLHSSVLILRIRALRRQRSKIQLCLGRNDHAALAHEAEVRDGGAHEDLAQQLAGRVENVHAIAAAGVHIALRVAVHAVGNARRDVGEGLAIVEGALVRDVIAVAVRGGKVSSVGGRGVGSRCRKTGRGREVVTW